MPVYSLCLAEVLTFEQGFKIIERMAVKRDWKNNLIFESAKQLWDRKDFRW